MGAKSAAGVAPFIVVLTVTTKYVIKIIMCGEQGGWRLSRRGVRKGVWGVGLLTLVFNRYWFFLSF